MLERGNSIHLAASLCTASRCSVDFYAPRNRGGASPGLLDRSYAGSWIWTSENSPSETVWKLLRTGQTPRHQPYHRRVDERLRARAQPFVILAHPPVLREPGEGPLHHPPPRQSHVPSRRHEPLPVDFLALLGPFSRPNLRHLLWYGLWGLAHNLHAQAHYLLGPPPAPALVACVQPQVLQTGEPTPRRLQ